LKASNASLPMAPSSKNNTIHCAEKPSYPRSPHTDIGALNGGLWRPEAQSDVLVPSSPALADSARLGLRLGVEEDVRLLLESALRLHGKFGGHGCGLRVVVEIASRKSSWIVLLWVLRRGILGLRFFGGLA
jgi:hypothetical protein